MPFYLIFALLAGAGGWSCSRTPPEPAPMASTGTAPKEAPTAVAPASAAAPSKCITPLASVAPPIPPPASSSACPPDPEQPSSLPTAMVAFNDAPGSPHLNVELVKSGHDVEKGLMYRRSMPEEHGMLFNLGERRDHTFWMQNTCIPLDMLFVEDDGTIVGIYESAPPLTTATRSVGCPSSWVLEVNAGWARRHGVKPGQRMGIPAAARD